jgi:hypothetical protein
MGFEKVDSKTSPADEYIVSITDKFSFGKSFDTLTVRVIFIYS